MKIMFASDLHGSAFYAEKMQEIFQAEQAETLVLLGDLLYHGPRNPLPKAYDPQKVVQIINNMADRLICVRGNCDADVDQMLLQVPLLSDYGVLFLDEKRIYISNGHVLNPETPMPLQQGDILINGHTHIRTIQDFGKFVYLNPGSISMPKQGQVHSYMLYSNKKFTMKSLDGDILEEYEVK